MKNRSNALNLARRCIPFWLVAFLLLSCETDSYDKGEGAYSLMHADFADLNVDSQKRGVDFRTDDGEHYVLTKPQTASWIQKGDTVYRATVYYNKVADEKAQLLSLVNMPTLQAHEPSYFKRQPQDPLGVESCWLTKNGRYLNLGLLLKNGRNDSGDEGTHALALVCDENHLNADLTHTIYYRLLHDQGSAPEYYTNRRYVCILLPTTERPDSVQLTVNTYDGVVVKKFKL